MPNARERAKKRASELGASKIWKMKVGNNHIRILPTPASKQGDDDLFLEFMAHQNVGKDKRFLRCGKDSSGKGKCYLCDKVIPGLRKKGKDARAAALAPRQIMAVQIAIVDKKGNMTGPEMFWPSTKVQRGLVAKIFDSKKRDYTDPKKGYTLTYKRVGTGMNDTDYFGPDIDDDPTPVPKEIIKKLVPFNEAKKAGNYLIPQYSEEAQKKSYLGLEEDESASESGSKSSSASESGSGSKSSSGSESKSGSDSGSESGSESESSSESKSGSGSASESGSESASSSESESVSLNSSKESGKKKTKKGAKKKGKEESSESESASESASS